MNFDSPTLYASLLWGSVGMGYWIYGKKQRSLIPALGGAAIVFVSYIAETALMMSLLSVAIMVAIYFLMKHQS